MSAIDCALFLVLAAPAPTGPRALPLSFPVSAADARGYGVTAKGLHERWRPCPPW
jgi:hypothetical protein